MRILKFLGRGSALNQKEGNTSAYYINNGEMLLIDCGENILERIQAKNLLDGIKNLYVLITHPHADHMGSLSSLIFDCHFYKNIKPYVIYDSPNNLQTILSLQDVDEDFYYMCESTDLIFESFDIGIENVIATKMVHKPKIDSYGYDISFKTGENIFYTGDTSIVPEFVLEGLRTGKFDELYTDTCLPHYEGNVHTSLNHLCDIAEKEIRHKIYCMHYDKDELPEKIIEEGFNIINI